ncbi:hypothetical protein LguiA_030106 [Lonicera macranthoides]
MEGRKLRAFVIVVLVLGMLIGKSRASFKDCYVKSYVFCIVDPSQTLCSCTTHCLKDCIFPPSPLDVNHPTHSYRDFVLLAVPLLCASLKGNGSIASAVTNGGSGGERRGGDGGEQQRRTVEGTRVSRWRRGDGGDGGYDGEEVTVVIGVGVSRGSGREGGAGEKGF